MCSEGVSTERERQHIYLYEGVLDIEQLFEYYSAFLVNFRKENFYLTNDKHII